MDVETTGWSRVDISPDALDKVQGTLGALGVNVSEFDVVPCISSFKRHCAEREYAGEYRTYGGADDHCFIEKALEHYLSIVLAEPKAGQVAIDVGSCVSVFPALLRRVFGVRCYEQDLSYPSGVHGDRIGSNADSIPLPDRSVDFMTLHCTFEHFEGTADTGFVRECARLLKPGGRVVILPLYLNANYCNITGEADEVARASIQFDRDARFRCLIPEWHNRFGRHYSPASLKGRVLNPASDCGLQSRLMRCARWNHIHPQLWIRWILTLEQPR